MAGIACARTLVQAGHRVTVFEQADAPGGRTATVNTVFGSFDIGAQYFTVRDPRFARAIDTVPGCASPGAQTTSACWTPPAGYLAGPAVARSALGASPGMQSLVAAWAQPLQQAGQGTAQHTSAARGQRDSLNPQGWQLRTQGADGSQHVYAGFDAVLFSQPATAAQALLVKSAIDCT